MPELLHTFNSGKMNKDLDERLVPNGQYRDALNLELSTSEGSNVGALQTVLGNTLNSNKSLNPTTGVVTEWTSNFISDLSNPKVIGTHRDNINEKIYWFIASDSISTIAEYDQIDDVIVPIVVDTQSILNFSANYLITGISALEGLLMWTDDQTEPKLINIEQWREASVDFGTHTVFNGRDFLESDLTVIKKYPLTAPELSLANTRAVDSNGDPAVVSNVTSATFTQVDPGDPTEIIANPPGTSKTLNWLQTPLPFFRVGDTLLLTTSAEDDDSNPQNYEARVQVTSIPAGNEQPYAVVSVLSVSENVQTGDLQWDTILEEDDPLFEFKFPRFAYRWKYEDNQYSSYSPFTSVAFLPGEFEYNPLKGYNLGMRNSLRQCTISEFITSDIPADVVEVDLLYKESGKNNVYKIDTFKKDDEIWLIDKFEIESEIISSVIPANQLIRPWDNVPRKAKSLEVSGNRLIFGNYLHNFTLLNNLNTPIKPSIATIIEPNPTYTDNNNENIGQPIPGMAYPSIKSQRTYQVGVVYHDKYGRQTPVFTSESAARKLPKIEANFYNRISAKIESLPPEGFTHFSFYVKENSQPYYNLAMDRWYASDDQNVWISFPSAERNKVKEDSFLELKKRHDTNDFVSEPARYKVIAISDEAPLFIKEKIQSYGALSTNFLETGFPLEDYSYVDIPKTAFEESTIFDASKQSDSIVRIIGGSNKSNWYDIISTSFLETGGERYRVAIQGRFGPDISFTSTDGTYENRVTSGLSIEMAVKKTENKAEFEGRFFVKLYRDSTLEANVLTTANADEYAINTSLKVGYVSAGSNLGRSWWQNYGANWFIDDAYAIVGGTGDGYSETNGTFNIDISFGGIWPEGSDFNVGRTVYSEYKDFVDAIESTGTRFRWKEDGQETVYEITSSSNKSRIRNYRKSSRTASFNDGSNKRKRWSITAKIVSDPPSNGFSPIVGNALKGASAYSMEILTPFYLEKSFTSTIPGIWETEPIEATELELYYKASNILPIVNHNDTHYLPWHNCFSFGNGVESDRIRDDFNSPMIGNGPIVSSILDEPYAEERRSTGFIYSGIFNSISGVNNLNQFIQGEKITLDLNPRFGSIQKLWSRDTDLIAFCEDKILTVPANKDVLYSAGGNASLTASNRVLGTPRSYAGEYGISKNPESFANYGFRAYFTDKARGAVMRLSSMPGGGGDGLTPISSVGMDAFFADNLAVSTSMIGGYDDNKKAYNLSINGLTSTWANKLKANKKVNGEWVEYTPTSTVVTFKEDVKGWQTRKSFDNVEGLISLNNRLYTFKEGLLWEHGTSDSVRVNFYGVQYDSSINLLINAQPNSIKSYNTLNYSGTKSREYVYSNNTYTDISIAEVKSAGIIPTSSSLSETGWYTKYIETDVQKGGVDQFLNKEGKWFQYIKGDETFFNTNSDNNIDSSDFSVQGIGRATSITGDLEMTLNNVHVYVSPSCFTDINNLP